MRHLNASGGPPHGWRRRIVGPERNHPQFVACSDKGLASWADLAIFAFMAKARIIFKMKDRRGRLAN
jgi:hypothetical protein